MTTNAIQSSHIYSTYFAPRGRSRIYTLGMQIAQLYQCNQTRHRSLHRPVHLRV